MAALRATALQGVAPVGALHANAEAVRLLLVSVIGLKGAFHRGSTLKIKVSGDNTRSRTALRDPVGLAGKIEALGNVERFADLSPRPLSEIASRIQRGGQRRGFELRSGGSDVAHRSRESPYRQGPRSSEAHRSSEAPFRRRRPLQRRPQSFFAPAAIQLSTLAITLAGSEPLGGITFR